MSKIEVNAIEPQCGTTLTVGASGDTITFPTGTTVVNNGTQSGFGRTGTVNWNTTPITSTPTTGANGIGYFIDASGGVKTINLPASPSAGDIMAVSDYAQTAETNNITIGRNGSNIQGSASDLIIARSGVAMTLVYVDATKGWVVTDTGAEADKTADPTFITATGGTITCCGDYKIHTFTSPGTFCVSVIGNDSGGPSNVDYLVVAGGGGGGGEPSDGSGGGGGAGGYRESSGAASGSYSRSPLGACVSALPVTAQGYPITVGGGGSAPNGNPGADGNNAVFSTIISTGGGGGGEGNNDSPGRPGGSGGGIGNNFGACGPTGTATAGAGNTPPVSPPQGFSGGGLCAPGISGDMGAGGGGATAVGQCASCGPDGIGGGNGGAGASTSITSSSVAYAGGGGGGSNDPAFPIGAGGTGGGGNGAYNGAAAQAGTCNTGGGGGGGENAPNFAGATGGSGIVVIRYKFK